MNECSTYLDNPNVPLLRPLWSLLDGIWGVLKGCWGLLVFVIVSDTWSIPQHDIALVEGIKCMGRLPALFRFTINVDSFKVAESRY